LGHDAVAQLEATLGKFVSFCNARTCNKMAVLEATAGAIVPATGAKYIGNVKRIKNTHSMPASGNFKG